MKEWATHLKYWIHHHHVWSSVVLIVVLVGTGVALYWTVNLVRFGLPPPPGQHCGEVLHASWNPDQTARINADLQSLRCFWQAYHSCQVATISQTYAGIDAGYTDTLTIEHRWFGCAIYGQQEDFANLDIRNTTFLCTQLSKKGDALSLSACDGIAPFVLAPRDMINDWYLCGSSVLPRPSERLRRSKRASLLRISTAWLIP